MTWIDSVRGAGSTKFRSALEWLRAVAARVTSLGGVMDQFFWLLVLISWLPIIAGFTSFVDHFIPWAVRYGDTAHRFAVPVEAPFIAIAVLIAAGALLKRDLWLLLCVPAPIAAAALGAAAGGGEGLPSADALYIIYLEAFVASLVVYLLKSRLRSWHVLVFVLLLLADLASKYVLDGQFFVIGYLFHGYALTIFDIIVVAAVIILARVIALAYLHNRGLFKGLNGGEVFFDVLKTTVLWAPMFLIFFGFNFLYGALGHQLERLAVNVMADPGVEGKGGFPLPEGTTLETIDLETAIQLYTTARADQYSAEAQTKLQEQNALFQANTGQTIDDTAGFIRNSFPAVFREPSRKTATGSCPTFSVS